MHLVVWLPCNIAKNVASCIIPYRGSQLCWHIPERMEQCPILLGHHSNRFCGEQGSPRALSGGNLDTCPLLAACGQAQIWGSAGLGRSGDTPCHMTAGSRKVYLRADRKQRTVMKATLVHTPTIDISNFMLHVITAHHALIVNCKLHTTCQWRLQRSKGRSHTQFVLKFQRTVHINVHQLFELSPIYCFCILCIYCV